MSNQEIIDAQIIDTSTKHSPNGPVLIVAKRAKNGMLILTAPNLEDYPCSNDQDIADAIKDIVDDPNQPRAGAGAGSGSIPTAGPLAPRNGRGASRQPTTLREEPYEEVDEGDPAYENVKDKMVVEGLSFLINKARGASGADYTKVLKNRKRRK